MIGTARYPMRACAPDGAVHAFGWFGGGPEAPQRAVTACGLDAYAWQLLLDSPPTCGPCLEAVGTRG